MAENAKEKPASKPQNAKQQAPVSRAAALRETGRKALDDGDYAASVEAFAQETLVNPGDAWTWLWLARAQRKAKLFVPAMTSLDMALSLKPAMPRARLEQISVFRSLEKEPAALTIARQLRKETREDRAILLDLLQRLEGIQDPRELVATADAVLRVDPRNGEARATLIEALFDLGEAAQAIEMLRSHTDRLPKAVVQTAELRWLLHQGSDIEAYETVVSWHYRIHSGHALRELADRLWQRGDLLQSMLMLERSIAMNPANSEAQQRREEQISIASLVFDCWRPSPPPERVGHNGDSVNRTVLVLDGSMGELDEPASEAPALQIGKNLLAADAAARITVLMPHPWNSDRAAIPLNETKEGVPVDHLLAPFPVTNLVTSLVEANAWALSGLIKRFEPIALIATEIVGFLTLASMSDRMMPLIVAAVPVNLLVQQATELLGIPVEPAARMVQRMAHQLTAAQPASSTKSGAEWISDSLGVHLEQWTADRAV